MSRTMVPPCSPRVTEQVPPAAADAPARKSVAAHRAAVPPVLDGILDGSLTEDGTIVDIERVSALLSAWAGKLELAEAVDEIGAHPLDVQAVAAPALRHRIILNFEGEAEGISTDSVVRAIIAETPVEPAE